MLAALVLLRWHLLDRGDDQALAGVGGAATETSRVAAAADERLVRFQQAVQRTRRVLAQTIAQLVRHGPGRLIGHAYFPLQKLGRDAVLIATYRIGGESNRRRETTRRDPSAFDEISFRRSPILAGGRPCIRTPTAAPSAAKLGARCTPHRQTHRAGKAPPSARYTSSPSRNTR
jgi:hypothetical protein